MFLGSYVSEITKRKNMFIWPGECHVHAGIRAEDINKMMKEYRNAEFLVHPECSCTSSTMYHMSKGDLINEGHILSTEGMMERAKNSSKTDFIVATETGILYRMEKENPTKNFIPIRKDAVCQYMKKITIDKVYNSLVNNVYQIRVPKSTADKARSAIERMLAIG
jgi:quinolinate synthase